MFCENGHVFESFMLTIATGAEESARTANISLPRAQACPVCGNSDLRFDGEFAYMADTVRALAAPSITLGRLDRLRALVDGAVKSRWTLGQVIEVLNTNPDLAIALAMKPQDASEEYATAPRDLKTWLLVILAVVTVMIQLKQLEVTEHPPAPSAPISQQLTKLQIEEIIRAVMEESKFTPRPPSLPVNGTTPTTD